MQRVVEGLLVDELVAVGVMAVWGVHTSNSDAVDGGFDVSSLRLVGVWQGGQASNYRGDRSS